MANIEKYLKQVPQVSRLIDGLLKTHWPPFSRLSDPSRTEWRKAVTLTHYVPLLDPVQEQPMREAGAQAFAKAVEVELRTRVLGIFRVEFRGSPELESLARQNETTPETKTFCDYLLKRSDLTLGSMLMIIDCCRSSTAPLLRRFKSWLLRKHPILLQRIDAFSKVGPLRNLAVHDTIASQNIEEIQRLCRQILEAINPGEGQTAKSGSS